MKDTFSKIPLPNIAPKKLKRAAATLLVPMAFFGLMACGTTSTKSSQSDKTSLNSSVKPISLTAKTSDTKVKKTSDLAVKSSHTMRTPADLQITTNKPVKITPISVPILEYHNSAYQKNWPWSLNPGQFEQEMTWLHDHHFHSITLQQFYNAYKYGAKLPSRPVVITFDDGHETNYTMATPILKKYGYKATEFVVTAAIGKKGVLSKKELLAMQAGGTWDIESHSVHHPYLAKDPQKKVVAELTQSKQTLQKLLGKPVYFFCYPYGSYNTQVVKDVKQAGYLLATTVHHGYGTPVASGTLTLNRLSVHQGLNIKTFASWFQPSLKQAVKSTKIKSL